MTVVGFVALSDYSSLFKNNTDSMFDALDFGTAVVTESTWESRYEEKAVHYRYSWLYDKAPRTDSKAASRSQKLCSLVYQEAPSLSEFIPQYENQPIRFTGEDFESDTMGTQVFIYILILILAFLVGIMTSDNLEQESAEIGTLRSLGYTKKELILHYSAIPMRVILAAALVGNALGYTVLKNIYVKMYYNSYSLPTYHTVWNAKALLLTTVIPLVLMFLVCTLLLSRKLRHPIQDFLRGEIGEKAQKKAMRLHHGIPLPIRYSIRIIRQNRAGFILLFIGIFLADFLAVFGMMFPKALDQYETDVQKEMIAKHVTLLKAPPSVQAGNITSTLDFIKNVQTKTKDAEPFYAEELLNENIREEEVSIYGIEPDSKYIHMTLGKNDVAVSSAYAEKYNLKKGDILHLKEKYRNRKYRLKITKIYKYNGGLAVFMEKNACLKLLGVEADPMKNVEGNAEALSEASTWFLSNGVTDLTPYASYTPFSGYFSNSGIKDISKNYISTDINEETLSTISRQLQHSMGQFMDILTWGSFFVYAVMMYLLTKLIIEKNNKPISLTKILGYTNSEITRLYLLPIFLVVVLSEIIAIPLGCALLKEVWVLMIRYEMNGWLGCTISFSIKVSIVIISIALFFAITLIESIRIRKIPMEQALKH
ncbi:MAG: ABC transporter permease [Eubacteriales bacterium]|nr:ABC transporter permease [Eubacteriales bacterium]